MRKKIPIAQVALGMHLDELCGPWIEHSFWRTKFVLTDPADIAKLHASEVKECWIDTAKGADIAAATDALRERVPAAEPRAAAEPAAPASEGSSCRTSLQDEWARAVKLRAQAKQTVTVLFDQARLGRALEIEGCSSLVDEISASVDRNAGALTSLVRLKSHDDYTFMHSVAVCILMLALAKKLGLDDTQTRECGIAGLLHDMGKAKIPLEVLNKPGKLSDDEFALVKRHPQIGHDLLALSGLASAISLDVCLHHHERPDGRGYPDGLRHDELSLHARMGAICDVYDAITSKRPYKTGWNPADSIAQMADWTKAGQFDPKVFRAFVDCVGIYPVGSLVRLQSQRLAVVVEQSEGLLVAPRVKVFFSVNSQMPVPTETLDLSATACRDRIVARESNDRWKFPYLDQLVAGVPA